VVWLLSLHALHVLLEPHVRKVALLLVGFYSGEPDLRLIVQVKHSSLLVAVLLNIRRARPVKVIQ